MTDRTQSKSGVAIIIVMGMIAMLTLAAVAFSVTMRTERKGAGNFRDSSQSRHMMWAAFTQALEDINDAMFAQGSNLVVYPEWNVLTSPGTGAWVQRAPVMSLGAMEYVADNLYNEVKDGEAHWSQIDVSGQVRGRYAYVIVNGAGVLDANVIGGTNRSGGASAKEILPDYVPEIADPVAFTNDRGDHVRYETLPELASLNSGLDPSLYPANISVNLSSREDESLLSASLSHVTITQRVFVADEASGLVSNAVQLKRAFAASGVSDPDAAYLSLIDYADTDSIPQDLAAGCAENVPMINEVILTYELQQMPGSVYAYRYTADIEWAYPFETAATNDFVMEMELTHQPGPNNQVGGLLPASGDFSDTVPEAQLSGHGYGIISTQQLVVTTVSSTNQVRLQFVADVKGKVLLGSTPVDQVPVPFGNNGVQVLIDMTIPAATVATQMVAWSECFDPRFNWDPSGASVGYAQWVSSFEQAGEFAGLTPKESPGTENTRTQYLFSDTTNAWDLYDHCVPDGDTHMYVANRAIRSIGELGYICYKPWSTIRLYDRDEDIPDENAEPQYHPVFDYFTAYPTNSPFAAGLVNVNTKNAVALASCFYGAPLREYDPASQNNQWAAAQAIAGSIIGFQPYYRLSDLCELDIWRNLPLGAGATEIEHESAIRNSIGLLTARQNEFTIFLLTDAYSAALGGSAAEGATLATSRAIVQVWRDPFPHHTPGGGVVRDGDGHAVHRTFVRFFRMLDE